MTSIHQLRWSDVWLLIAIYYAARNKATTLDNVIAAADAINHAILNFEELSSGLVRLQEHGFITVQQRPLHTCCTEKSLQMIEGLPQKKKSLSQLQQEIEHILHVSPWAPEPLPHPQNNLVCPGFEASDYKVVVDNYLGKMKSPRK